MTIPTHLQFPPCAQDDAELIFAGEYDIPLKEPPKTVLDLGANVGLFTAWALAKWPRSEITAYEPWDENCETFRSNLSSFTRDHVRLCESAVRDRSGRLEMWAGRNDLCHSFTPAGGQERFIYAVAADLLESHEFVKMDVEGSEWEIIQKLDLTKTKAIAMEAHSPELTARIIPFLTLRGFALYDRHPTLNGCCLLKFIRRVEIVPGKKLMVAIPTYGQAPAQFWECLMRLQQQPTCNLVIKTLNGDSLVCRARNSLTQDFLDSDCTDLLFIDSDLIFSPEHVARIMSHGVGVVGGFYPKKQDGPLQWVCNAALNETKPNPDGLQQVRYMGTGFLRVQRYVIEAMVDEMPQIAYQPDGQDCGRIEHDIWPVGLYKFQDGSKRYLSEDWYFCQRWIDMGARVWGDTGIVLKHVGQAVYPLQSQMSQITR